MLAFQLARRALPSAARALATAPARTYFSRTGMRPVAQFQTRLDKKQLPFYMQDSPVDYGKFVEQFSPEEAKERQEWIDKIIAMADQGQEPNLEVYEGVLNLLVRRKDGQGAKVILNTLREIGLMDDVDSELLDRATELVQKQHVKSYWR